MQIPDTPLKFIADLFTQPPVGGRPQIEPPRQAKVNVQPAPASPRPATEAAARLSRLGAAETLDEAVQILRAKGRLPRRGSLLDIRA